MTIKDSGTRKQYQSGMIRDADNKTEYTRLLDGPMLKRWAEHLTKGAVKYPDLENGRANWTLANSEEELRRFNQSAFRHFLSWIQGEVDEDHAAGIVFNVNGAEYVRQRLSEQLDAELDKQSDEELYRELPEDTNEGHYYYGH